MKTIPEGKTLCGTGNRTWLPVNVESVPNGSCGGWRLIRMPQKWGKISKK